MTLDDFKAEWLNECQYIVAHTSGSTGTPKEIHLPKRDMMVSAHATCRRFGIDNTSVLHLPLSLDYIAGKMMAVRAFVSGARLIIEPPSSSPLSSNPECDITLSAIVPSQLDGLLESAYVSKIKNVIVGGAPLSYEQELKLRESPFHAYATYGMTETCSHVALRDITRADEHFTAMPGITFATDSAGRLEIIAPDYSFGRLMTNDVVELIDPTHFRWLGRYDSVINSGGVKVHPEQVEDLLRPYMGDTDYMITSRPSSRWGSEVVLHISADVDEVRLAAEAFPLLSAAQRPKAIIRVEKIPRTSNGKIRRR